MVESDCFPEHAAIDSTKKLFSASIPQLHKAVLFNETYGWLGILIGKLQLSLQMTY